MARMARLVVPGIPHHVTQRGSRRQQVFFGDEDYSRYLRLLARFSAQAGTAIVAYCLMPNHVHLIMVPGNEAGLRAALGEVHRRYALFINQREGWRGHLWQERFYSSPMDEWHLAHALGYVESNPVRSGLCSDACAWPWSSARARADGGQDALLDALPGHVVGAWRELRAAPTDAAVDTRIACLTRTGRPLGDAAFIARLEQLSGRRLRSRRRRPD
ncbi:MAG: transposase [Gammaproteobacteria bacterium]|nr:transposase [Gammaproteobacteria bacterium]